jgi:hypothetical protein
MESHPIQNVRIADINVGKRYRNDLGDIAALAESIDRLELLQPIGVTSELRLIFGARRIEAFKLRGRDRIPARVLDVQSIIQGEYDENDVRKDLSPSEKVAIARVIERELKGRVGRTSKKIPRPGGELRRGESTDLAAKRVGFGSGDTYERAKTVVDNGIPELIAAVDAGKIQIKPAAKFAKQDPTKQAQQIAAAGGNVTAAVIAFRENLPTRHEARKIAAETGVAILGKDGRFHTDATDEERARGETYLRVAAALRTLRDLGFSAEEIVACVPPGSHALFDRLVDQTTEFICSIQASWRCRYVAWNPKENSQDHTGRVSQLLRSGASSANFGYRCSRTVRSSRASRRNSGISRDTSSPRYCSQGRWDMVLRCRERTAPVGPVRNGKGSS